MHKIKFFPGKKNNSKKICVPTLPKIFRPVTRNTHIFLFGLHFQSQNFDIIIHVLLTAFRGLYAGYIEGSEIKYSKNRLFKSLGRELCDFRGLENGGFLPNP